MTRHAALISRLRDERGSVIVLVAVLSMAVFLILSAVVVDVGNARQASRNYQNAADAAALAGAQELKFDQAQRAIEYAKIYAFQTLFGIPGPQQVGCPSARPGEAPAGSVCYESDGVRVHVKTPSNDPIAGGTTQPMSTKQINVMVCGTVRAGFFSLLKKQDFRFNPCRQATATAFSPNQCAVCVLEMQASNAFALSGNGIATVTGSSAWVNSSSGQAATNSGWGFDPRGGFYVYGGASGFMPPPAGASQIPDPLGWLPEPRSLQPPWPDWTTLTPRGDLTVECATPNSTVPIDPGIYGSIKVNPAGLLTCDGTNTIRLNPGSYVIRHRFEITTDATIVADLPGVTIYFACDSFPENPCSPGEAPAYFDHSGNGPLNLHAPTGPQGHPYTNLLFFFDRNIQWDSSERNLFSGGGATDVTGTIYGPTANFELRGGGDYHSLFVVGRLEITGNGLLNIVYEPGQNVPTYLPALIT